MYTGTLIEDLIAGVERVKAQAGDVEMHKVRAETGVEDNDTEEVPVGSLNADSDPRPFSWSHRNSLVEPSHLSTSRARSRSFTRCC